MARNKPTVPADVLAGESKQVKASIAMPAALLWRLSTIASKVGRDRSEFAAELIDQGLSRYALDKALRKFSGEEPGQEDTAA